MKNIKQKEFIISKFEHERQELIDDFISAVKKDILDDPAETRKSPAYTIVNVKSLSDDCIMSPSYYIPDCQATAVEFYLRKKNRHFDELLEELITNKKVSMKGSIIKLNPKTIEVLEKHRNA